MFHLHPKKQFSQFRVCASWEESAVTHIKKLAKSVLKQLPKSDFNIGTTIKIENFHHYVQVINFLIEQKKQDRKEIFLQVGSYQILLQPNDLYCSMKDSDIKCCYATVKPSEKFSKKFSKTLWNYMMGNNTYSSSINKPQDAILLCAILFSEVIRNPKMFFHNILLMQCFKSWGDFRDHHPMLTGGSWKHQGEKTPEKVIKREEESLICCVKKMREKVEATENAK